MDPKRWAELRSLVEQALDRPTAERAAFLADACGDDRSLRAEAEELLRFECGAGTLGPSFAPAVATVDALDAPDTIGPYRLVRTLGEGGFGSVHEAVQTEPLRRTVAIKLLKPGMDSREVLARFDAERHALARMNHPNIARVLDAGATPQGRPYFVMERVLGRPITADCDARGMSVDERVRLFLPVCRAIQHSHQKGVIHRDLKPSNILVEDTDGRPVPKVIDFGIAKATGAKIGDFTVVTHSSQVIGTPAYMSPEQADATKDVDSRTDVYSLGAVLYELLTGARPFDDETLLKDGPSGIARVLAETEPPRPSARVRASSPSGPERARARALAGELDWIVLKALEKDPERRYQTPEALSEDLERYLRREAVGAGPPSAAYRLRRYTRRHRVALTVAALVVGALVAGLVLALRGKREADRERAAAVRARDDAEAVTGFLTRMLGGISRERVADRLAEDLTSAAFDEAGAEALKAIPRSAWIDAATKVYVAHLVEPAAAIIDERFDDRPLVAGRLRRELGAMVHNLSRPGDAAPLLRRAYEQLREALGASAGETLRTRSMLAVVLSELRQVEEAAALVIPEHEVAAVDDQELLAVNLMQGADVALQSGDFERAESLFQQAVSLCSDANRVQRANVFSLRGTFLIRQGRVDEAKEVLDVALADALAEEIPELAAQCRNALAAIAFQQDRPLEAAELLRAVRDDLVSRVGAQHPDVYVLETNLGFALVNAGRVEEGTVLLERAVAGMERAPEDTVRYLVGAQASLAKAYEAAGRLEDAAALLKDVVARRTEALGAVHFETISSRAQLALVLDASGHADEAFELARSAYADGVEHLPPGHPSTNSAASRLLAMLKRRGEDREALRVIQEVEEALAAARPLAHPERQEARMERVRLLASTGDPERAVEEMVANWDALVDDVGPDARITREVAVVVLDVALEAGLEPAARGFALEHVPGRIGATAPEAIAARRVLGQMLVERGRIEEGRALVEAVLAAAIEALGEEHPETAAARDALAEVAATETDQAARPAAEEP